MMSGNVEATQRGAIAADVVPMLAEEAKKRKKEGQIPKLPVPPGPDLKTNDLAPTGRSREIAAKAVGVGATSVGRALQAKKKHEVRAPLRTIRRKVRQS